MSDDNNNSMDFGQSNDMIALRSPSIPTRVAMNMSRTKYNDNVIDSGKIDGINTMDKGQNGIING